MDALEESEDLLVLVGFNPDAIIRDPEPNASGFADQANRGGVRLRKCARNFGTFA